MNSTIRVSGPMSYIAATTRLLINDMLLFYEYSVFSPSKCIENYTAVVYSHDQSSDNDEKTRATVTTNEFYYLPYFKNLIFIIW